MLPVTVDALRVRFPSLATASQTACQQAIDSATIRTPADVWGALTEDGIMLLAAHNICIDPRGVNAKLADKSGMTVYLRERMRLATIVAAGHRVTE